MNHRRPHPLPVVLLLMALVAASIGVGPRATPALASGVGKRVDGVSLKLLMLTEQQMQVRPGYELSGTDDCHPIDTFVEIWTVSPAIGVWDTGERGRMTVVTRLGMCGSSGWSGFDLNGNDLRPDTTYTITLTGGYADNMVTASRVITTNSVGWNTTTTTTSPATDGSAPADTVPAPTTPTTPTTVYDDPALYMAQINENNVVTNLCVCTVEWVRANPHIYPGTWVPVWMGVNGKNYPGNGWIYDPVAQNFYPPSTTTTSTSTSTTVADSRAGTDVAPPVSTATGAATFAVGSGNEEVEVRDTGKVLTLVLRPDLFAGVRRSGPRRGSVLVVRAVKRGAPPVTLRTTVVPGRAPRIVTSRNLEGYRLTFILDGRTLFSTRL